MWIICFCACRYILLLIVSFFFVIPIPLFKYAFVSVGNYIFPKKWNDALVLNGNQKFLNLNKFYAVVNNKILFPNYRKLYKFFLGIWLCCVLFIAGREIAAYIKFRKSVNKIDRIKFFPECLNKYSPDSRWHKIKFCKCENLKGAFTYGFFSVAGAVPVMAYNPPVVIQNENYSVVENCDWVECDEGDFMYQDPDEITFELVDEYVILENGEILIGDGNEKI